MASTAVLTRRWPRICLAVAVLLMLWAVSFWVVAKLELSDQRLRELLASPWLLPAVFVANLVTYIFPAMASSGLLLTAGLAAIGADWPTLLGVAVSAAAGQTLGELSGYLVGVWGQAEVSDHPEYRRAVDWIGHHDRAALSFLFVSALLPNPTFKLGAIAAGALRYSVWRFLAAIGAGRLIKNLVVVVLGQSLREFGQAALTLLGM